VKKICLILGYTILLIFIFVSCSKKDVTNYKYTYTGENEQWNVVYKVNESVTFTNEDNILDAETEAKNVLTITYKGNLTDLSSVKHTEISYECSTEGGKRVEDYSEGESISSKTFTLISGGKNGALHSGDEIITVTINIDGDTQTLELKNKP